MDDTTSDSSEESSTDYSTDSSSDDDGMETAEVDGCTLQLPQGLCDKKEIFDGVINTNTWNNLSNDNKQYLQTFLPNFPPECDLEEKNRTLQKLFEGDVFNFVNPLAKFHDDLKAGYYRPDIANMRKIIRRAERKEADFRYKKLREKLKVDVVESQKNLLTQISNLPPGIEPKFEKRNHDFESDYVVHRTKRRYYQVLTSIQAKVDDGYCSPDENYPEGPPVALSRKQRRHLNGINTSHSGDIYHSTTSTQSGGLDLDKYVTPAKNPFYLTDDAYRHLLMSHVTKRRKFTCEDDKPEMNTKGVTLTGVVTRTRLPYVKHSVTMVTTNSGNKNDRSSGVARKRVKKESETDSDSVIDAVTCHPPVIKSKMAKTKSAAILVPKIKSEPKVVVAPPVDEPTPAPPHPPPPPPPVVIPPVPKLTPIVTMATKPFVNKPLPVAISELDLMSLPIDLANTDIDVMEVNKPELMQETHSNFLSLIRDIVCSTSEHRMSFACLEVRLKSWQENPISPLNDWYNLTDNWTLLLKHAVDFLCGNHADQPDDFVPYMEHKANLDVYQWIGAGRDSDSLLSPLCRYWLEHRGGNNKINNSGCQVVVKTELRDEAELEVSDRSQTPPPPRCQTNWTVRKATSDQVRDFREQERKRYDNPHKAFTYRCYGYESVVGPLKGIYNASVGNNSKARGHTMLNADRPNFVTILSLVRDATARLPNGEGTRAEICELLKSSQYISSSAPDNVLQTVVSGALDRMHTQFDPCVKYDSKRKIWIYLHRNRSEEDFERIHQQYQGVNKPKKPSSTKRTNPKPKVKKVTSTVTAVSGKSMDGDSKVVVVKATPSTTTTTPPPPPVLIQRHHNVEASEQKEINEALQAIVQKCQGSQVTGVKNPTTLVNLNKKMVKIISPGQGKSLIIPTSTSVIGKQMNDKQTVTAQQLLQSINKQKLLQQQQKQSEVVVKETNNKVPMIQSITPQQLSNIKNVTLVRNVNVTSQNQLGDKTKEPQQQQIQIKTQGTLTVAQQQQIIQTLKQKILPQGSSVLTTNQQQQQQQAQPQQPQIVVKQKAKSDVKSVVTSQPPVVAKVLTNAAGQVISVESLLAHQKQHGSLPQGTTLRVSGTKGGQPNIIQLTGTSQNNIIAIAGQPKLVVTSTQPQVLPTKSPSPSVATTKLNPKVAQQLINAKVITTAQLTGASGDSKLTATSPKIFLGQQNQLRLGKNATATSTIRMVNAANLNLTHIGGKPVLLAGKGGIQGQNLILQGHGASGGLVLQGATVKQPAITSSAGAAPSGVSLINQQSVMLGPQIKLPQQHHHQQVIFKNAGATTSAILDGHPVRLQTTSTVATSGVQSPQQQHQQQQQQRVVLASQGQGGQIVAQQILLPAGFQGTAINIKALQGIKVIPLAQAHGQARGVQSRQVFARVMSPSVVKTSTVGSTVALPTTQQQMTEKSPDPVVVISTPER